MMLIMQSALSSTLLSVSVSVSVSVLVDSEAVLLARTGVVSCRTSRPAARAKMIDFFACMMNSGGGAEKSLMLVLKRICRFFSVVGLSAWTKVSTYFIASHTVWIFGCHMYMHVHVHVYLHYYNYIP